MRWKIGILACFAFAVVAALGMTYGQEPSPPSTAKRVGEKFDSAVQSIKRGAKGAEETIQQQYARARTAVHNMGVSGRIYARLHWDKDLQTAKIEIDVKEGGAATLRGTVPDTKAKTKAVELTMDTVGVAKVVDQLTIQPAAETTPADNTTATPAKP